MRELKITVIDESTGKMLFGEAFTLTHYDTETLAYFVDERVAGYELESLLDSLRQELERRSE